MAKLQAEYDTQDVMLQSRNPSGFTTGKSQQKDQESFSSTQEVNHDLGSSRIQSQEPQKSIFNSALCLQLSSLSRSLGHSLRETPK